jgi:hypothetical protein
MVKIYISASYIVVITIRNSINFVVYRNNPPQVYRYPYRYIYPVSLLSFDTNHCNDNNPSNSICQLVGIVSGFYISIGTQN